MLDLKTFSDILGAESKHKKDTCRHLVKKVKKTLGETRRLLYDDYELAEKSDREEAVWLYENFSHLEEVAKADTVTLKKLGRLLSRNGEPLFFGAFFYLLRKNAKLENEDIQSIVDLCNEYDGGISLQDTMSLLPLLRMCVCMRICECFLEGGSDKEQNDGENIRNLFFSLDELCFFDEEKVFKNNASEKFFFSDPSGLYKTVTPSTKALYRKNLIRLSHKFRTPQKELAAKIVKRCENNKDNDRHIGKYLCDKPCGGKTYMFLVFFMTILFTLLLCLISPVFAVSVVSVYGCSRLLADKFFVRFFVKDFTLPALELDKIPDGCGVMTVITSLLTGSKGEEELFEKLEIMYNSCGEKNAYFGLLCDLADSNEKEGESDREIIDSAQEKILMLRKKYGNRFFFFVRQREYSKSEEMYIAPERKRGAVNTLTKFLCGKGDGFGFGSIKPDEEICRNIKYIFTLDADTNLAFDCLRTMVGIMLHPQNKPVLDNDRCAVVEGYGILQPAMNPTLESSKRSFFSSVMCGHGGVDLYSSGGSDKTMAMFGRSIFCGKGMFDKDCFYEVLCGKNEFKKNSVLSHDAPEGARLRCAYVGDVTLTDSFPSEELSFYKRQHRWIRGDIQNIPFLFGYVETSDGSRIKNKIGIESKFFMWQNVYSALLPVFSLATLFVSAFCEGTVSSLLVSASLAVYILPFGYSVFMGAKRALWHNFRRVFYSEGIYTGIWTSFLRMLFRLCAIPKSAAVSLDAITRSAYRSLVSHKKTLEWTTAAQNDAEKRDGLLGYVKKNLVNAVCGTLLFTLSSSGFLKLLSLMWLFMPVFAYHSGKERKKQKRHIGEQERKKLKDYCSDMWKFFGENVSDSTNHLPTDNLSLYPERKISRMTSPTNIGLYLVSCLCAFRLGFVDKKEMCRRIYSCLESVNELEKYKGLLYNWYDIFRKEPMTPRYISSVDLGNYVACLICVKEGIRELAKDGEESEKIFLLCQKLIKEADLSLLFDNTRKLFYIGAEERDGKLIYDRNRYDMLMSEARILSFCAVAQRCVPSQHLKHLSRRFVQGDGYMGLASWSGTAFEFFMPEIFMPAKSTSLVYEALCFAYTNIRKKGAGHGRKYVFGISESCYNEFDSASNYKYHAFGIPEIAVNVFEKQNVISPYSSFLCLDMSPGHIMKNLERLEKMGAYGEYGFYESVDFERPSENGQYSLVKCFMSHHVGMSIASCVNVLCDGLVSEWFFKDEKMKSAYELTQEKIPYDAYVKKSARQHYIKKTGGLRRRRESSFSDALIAKLSTSKLEIVSKKGKLDVKNDNLLLARKKCFPHSLSSFEVTVEIDGEKFFFDKKCRLLCDDGQIVMTKTLIQNCGDKFEAALSVTAGNNTCDTVRMRVRLRQMSGDRSKNVNFSLSFYPLLDTKHNSNVCSFFDSKDFVLDAANDGTEIYFRRFSSGMCIASSVIEGKNKRASAEGERASLSCLAEKKDGIMCSEFAICLSDSTKCVQVGLVRCREDSFLSVARKMRENQHKSQDETSLSSHGKRLTGVLGSSVVKEERKTDYPINSREYPLYLISSCRFSALLGEKSLGVSFENDINCGRVTAFSGIDTDNVRGEVLLFDDGFDLCKNSKSAVLSNNCAIFEGEYRDTKYRADVYVLPDEPCKIIVVTGAENAMVSLRVSPSDECEGQRHIGAGLVFFGKSGEHNYGFAFGVSKDEDGEYGASYLLSEDIQVRLEAKKNSRCIFCIGKADEEKAKEIYDRIRNDTCHVIENCIEFSKSIKIKENMPDERMKSILAKYFVFPKDKACRRVFVKSSEELFLFDCLMLMFSDFPEKKEYLIRAFDTTALSGISRSLLCLILCEYVSLSGNTGVTELKVRGETLYKRCLSYLSVDSAAQEENDIFLLALEKFSLLCNTCQDLRTALSLEAKIQKITERGKGGIFL
ncbi:MAG: hypothetical protein IJW06_00960 [Clostridia bacterium]|nr:hypothetical protein [Clostridia bacterium]